MRYGFKKTSASRTYLLGYCRSYPKVCDTEDVIVVVEGEHSCMTARGIKARGAKTRTSAIRGLFDTDHELRNGILSINKRLKIENTANI